MSERDRLAEEWANDGNYDSIVKAFKAGWDAAMKHMEPSMRTLNMLLIERVKKELEDADLG